MLLMNVNVKIVDKIITNQVKQHMNRLIHYNQVKFIPQMQDWFFIPKQLM